MENVINAKMTKSMMKIAKTVKKDAPKMKVSME